MRLKQPFTCRRSRSAKRWAVAMMIAMTLSPVGRPVFQLGSTVHAQQQAAPVSAGFNITAGDLRFIYEQILVAQDHAAVTTQTLNCGVLLGPGPNQVGDPQLPRGLRTVDGSCNNLVAGQNHFGQSDLLFPRLTTPVFRAAEAGTSYTQLSGNVIDSQPRIASNLVSDQTANNPAALAAASNPCGSGGFVCSPPATLADVTDPVTGALFIPNITPDFGLSAPFNLMFTFFGQFFDHGLDLVKKGGNGTVLIQLKPDDPLFVPGGPNVMTVTRATVNANHDSTNETTPWVDQNQTYTSHPSHQVFLREYALNGLGKPVQTGKVLDGAFCAPRPTGIPGDNICNIGNWNDVKRQARQMLGIQFVDADIFDVPLIVTDPYGHFRPGPNGFPQMVRPGNVLVEGNPAANGGLGVAIPADALRTGHAFLNDIAHNAVPAPGLVPDANTTITNFRTGVQDPGTYDDELLGIHMVTGDGRGNENIALTMVHQMFHAEHNRLAHDIDRRINTLLTPTEIAAWHAVHAPSGWDYGERLFQAARFATEMQYQHLVFEEFARTVQPLINPFLGGITSINGAISAEFAHTVYRLGHSMLPEIVTRINMVNGVETPNDIRLFDAFLNPLSYNDGGAAGTLTADKAAGSIVRGLSRSIGNELDEFVTESVRDQLLGLPLDLITINIARGRSEGIPPLNVARRQFFTVTRDTTLKPYANWFEFGLNLKHHESLANFIAAYGTDPSITSATTAAAKRSAAQALVTANGPFMFQAAATSGLDTVDFWPGGMAEKQAVFGGLLGSTFNFVFEQQLEHLQDGDRFYYLQRLDGQNFVQQLESNSFAELIRRNTDFQGGMDVIFKTADIIFNLADFTGTAPVDLGDGMSLFTTPDGTKIFFDPLHTGKNIEVNGTAAVDKFKGDVGDDTMYGNAGIDRLDGYEGNDTLHGGEGDDVLFGGNGDDVLKGGPGNDALSSGPGFGGDLLLAGDGNDFLLCDNDGCEHFGGPGNDVIVDGAMRAEAIFGGEGDDWLFDGDGHDGGMFGDGGNVFDLLAGLSAIGGDDVLGGGPGQDNHFGEGGDDVMVMSEGSNKFFGDYGFDWITLRGWHLPEFVELSLLALPNVPVNFNDLRNKYRFVDGASGWDMNDHIAGSNEVLCEPPGEIAECLVVGMELTTAGAAKISGLAQFMADFGADLNDPAIPGVKGVGFMGGDILLGGRGSDILEGKKGDDLIDGDLWLNVQLRAALNDGTVKLVDSPVDLADDVFADPQRLNPGSITIVKSIVTPPAVPADCGAAAPVNCDTAVYNFPRADFDITPNANGTVTVTHVPAIPADVPASEGTDTLRNIEQLQFTDMTIPTPVFVATAIVPNVVGLTDAAAADAITAVGLLLGDTVGIETLAVPVGTVLGQSPAAGTRLALGGRVNIDVAIAPRALVPSVVGLTQAVATASITGAGLVVGTITIQASAIFPPGTVTAQDPDAGKKIPVGSAVNLVVTPGATVPNVVGSTQATATTTLSLNGLVVGTITIQSSATVPAGSVISQTPTAGTVVTPGSAVNLVVSNGTAPTIAGTVTRNAGAANTTVTSPAFTTAANTLIVAFLSADGPIDAANTAVNGFTNTGAPLTWTRAARSNVQLGTAEIWWAFTPTARASSTVTAVLNNSEPASLTVMTFTGAASSLAGAATAIANAASGQPSASVVTTRDNSLVIAVGTDWDAPRIMTAAAGQQIVNQFRPPVGDTYWTQRTSAPVTAAGTAVSIKSSYGATMPDRWNMAVIEIRRP